MTDERTWIGDLVNGTTVNQVLAVQDKDLRTTRNGDYYICVTLADRTGTIPARMWQANPQIFETIPAGGFLHVRGRAEDYKGTLQLVLDAVRPCPADKVDIADYLPATAEDVDAMWDELVDILRTISDKPLQLLIKQFVTDEAMVAAYKKSPAAMQMHHPFVGGLLEHTLGIARAAKALLPLYPQLNADLVLAGVFLHDIGKTEELAAELTINYTDRGMLVGHITTAAIWVQQAADRVAAETGKAFPQRTVDLLQHIILSHHGVHEYGSPKLPALGEAFFLHYLDNLDAKMFMTRTAIASDADPASQFTGYIRALETRIYKSADRLDPQ